MLPTWCLGVGGVGALAHDATTSRSIARTRTPELAELALEQELQDAYVQYAETDEEVQMATQYALKKLSGVLKAEIQALTTRRTSEVCRHRSGPAVLPTTVESDISTLKR